MERNFIDLKIADDITHMSELMLHNFSRNCEGLIQPYNLRRERCSVSCGFIKERM